MSELKPCPFCGGEPEIRSEPRFRYSVRCRACGAFIDAWSRSADEAAATWNRRAPLTNDPLTLEQLREHYITCHDCANAEYSRTITCGYICRSKSSPCRGRVTVGYDFCSYGHRKPEGSEIE